MSLALDCLLMVDALCCRCVLCFSFHTLLMDWPLRSLFCPTGRWGQSFGFALKGFIDYEWKLENGFFFSAQSNQARPRQNCEDVAGMRQQSCDALGIQANRDLLIQLINPSWNQLNICENFILTSSFFILFFNLSTHWSERLRYSLSSTVGKVWWAFEE